jgi:hypothetical protein
MLSTVALAGANVVKSIAWCVGVFALFLGSAFAEDVARTVNPPTSGTTTSAQSQDGRWEGIFNEDTRYYSWHSTRGFAYGPTYPPTSNALIVNSFTSSLNFPTGFPAPVPLGSGSLLYVPFAFQVTGRPNDDFKTEFLLRGGHVNATQTTTSMSGYVATATDTTMTEKITYLGFTGVQPFASVTINIPTGRSVLLGTSAFARMDSDLVLDPNREVRFAALRKTRI